MQLTRPTPKPFKQPTPETVKRRGERNLKKKFKRKSKSSMPENPGPGARPRSPKNRMIKSSVSSYINV
jgi:hypothetical protein